MAPATWHGTRSLATECYEAADGDFEIALLLALDYRDKFRGPGPRAQETVQQPPTTCNDLGAGSLVVASPGPLAEREAA